MDMASLLGCLDNAAGPGLVVSPPCSDPPCPRAVPSARGLRQIGGVRRYLVPIGGLVVIIGVLAFAMSGSRLPGTVNSPSADVSGKTAQ